MENFIWMLILQYLIHHLFLHSHTGNIGLQTCRLNEKAIAMILLCHQHAVIALLQCKHIIIHNRIAVECRYTHTDIIQGEIYTTLACFLRSQSECCCLCSPSGRKLRKLQHRPSSNHILSEQRGLIKSSGR